MAEIVVVFWKQNDVGLYGRRVDSLIAGLSRADSVEKVVVVEPLLDASVVEDWLPRSNKTHYPLIARLALWKSTGRMDTPKVTFSPSVVFEEQDGARIRQVELREHILQHKSRGLKVVFVVFPYLSEEGDLKSLWDLADEIVVDFVDDNRTWHERDSSQRERIGAQYRWLLQKGHRFVTNNMVMARRLNKLGARNVEILENKVPANLIETNGRARQNPPLFPKLRPEAPSVVYVGNLEAKLDIRGLGRLIKRLPEVDFLFIGSDHMSIDLRPLKKFSNVHFLGAIPADRIMEAGDRFTIGLIPHKRTHQTASMNPMKAPFYQCLGIPAIAFRGGLNLRKSPNLFISRTTFGRTKLIRRLSRGEVPKVSKEQNLDSLKIDFYTSEPNT